MKTLKTLSSQLLNLDVRLLMMLVMVALMVMPELAMASAPGADDLPFVGSMKRVSDSLSGPFATALSIVAIVGAGAMLIFGGDMNGFMRTLIFLVMVIAMIITAGSLVTFLGGSSAVVAGHVPSFASDVQRFLV
ncbi:TrbC/VirB2 family protein [Stenotrophomonas sp. C3(2023)]|uniref:TrbC/VirB2 family protein n=1 Tax=Stenotrophomonas sp. C3(2023) TaxID=3080277 RepID=UPI00293C1970|nr:TrbC/VirB2 family protein [Stenotrophomonas sp. C3(2023)]MDV3470254.1 TrbC/VirB2 family protein [Stenotrophomonas sp. C3(2023)]